jgi:hypothetical protein
MRKFLDTISDHWFTVLMIFLAGGAVAASVHNCMRQDACEVSGGKVIDRARDSWKCVRPPSAPGAAR